MGKTSSIRQPFPKECYYQPISVNTSSTTARPNLLSLYDPKSSTNPWMQTCTPEQSKSKIICVANKCLALPIEERDDVFKIYRMVLEQFYLNHFKIFLAIEDKKEKKLYEVSSWPIPVAILQKVIELSPQKMAKLMHQQYPHCSRDALYYLSENNARNLLLSLSLNADYPINLNALPQKMHLEELRNIKISKEDYDFKNSSYQRYGFEELRNMSEQQYFTECYQRLSECTHLVNLEVYFSMDEMREDVLAETLSEISKRIPKECQLTLFFDFNTFSYGNAQKLNSIDSY